MTALVILTQAVQGGDSLALQLSGGGLQVERWPLVRLAPAPMDAIGPVLARLADFNWIFLPSPSAVRLVAQRMKELDVAWPPGACAGLVGPASVEAFRECFGEAPRIDTTAQPPHDAVHLMRALAGDGSLAPCTDGPIRALVLNRPDARTQWLESLRELAQSVEVVVAYTAEPAADGPPPHLLWRLQRLLQAGGVVHWVVGAGSHLDTLLKALPATLAQWTRRQPLLVPHAAIRAHARALGFENCMVYKDRRDLVERLQYLGNIRVRAPAEPACQPAHHDADNEEDLVLSPEQQKDSAIPGARPDGGKDAKATPAPGSPGSPPVPARPVPAVSPTPSASPSSAAGSSTTSANSPGTGNPAPSSPLTKSPAAAGIPAGGSAASSNTPGDKSADTSARTSASFAAGPAAASPGAASPSMVKPAAAPPSAVKPGAASTSTVKPGAASTSTVKPGAAGPSAGMAETAGSSTPRPGAPVPSPARPGPVSPVTSAAAPSSASAAAGPSAASTTASNPPAATSGSAAAMKPAEGQSLPRMSDPPAPVPPVPPSAGGTKRGGGLWALLTLLLVCLLAAGGWWYTQQRFLAAERDSARRVQEAEARAVKLEDQMKGLRDSQNQLQSRSTSLEEKLAQSATQQEQLAGLYDEIAKTRGDTALAEVEQSVQMANQHLELTGNVQAALLALQNAERRLGDSEESQGIAARRLIVQDIERLKALPEIDLAGSAGRLDEVINSIDRLPLLADADDEPPAPAVPQQPAPATPDGPSPSAAAAGPSSGADPAQPVAGQDQPAWQRVYDSVVQVGVRGFEAVRDEFRSLVTIRRMDRPDSLFVLPEQKQAARENLKLLLLNARLNLLNRHENLFRQDLTRAIQAMERLHDTDHQDVKGAIATLKSLQDQPLALNLPSLGESLGAIRAARAASEKRS